MRRGTPERVIRSRLLSGAQLIGWSRWHYAASRRPTLSIETRRVLGPSAIQVFFGISAAWQMSFREEMRLLGLPRPVWSSLARGNRPVLPIETLRRIAFIARVFEAINMLFPAERADAWMRAPNSAQGFGRRSALAVMVEAGPAGMTAVRLYLQGQLYG
jgi:hypothetical protein